MRTLDKMPDFPEKKRKRKEGLTDPQFRVLKLLARKSGCTLTRAKIAKQIGVASTAYTGTAIGLSDPKKRETFENTRSGGFRASLLSLGYVEEVKLEVEGTTEIGIRITALGRQVYAKLEKLGFKLRPLHGPKDKE